MYTLHFNIINILYMVRQGHPVAYTLHIKIINIFFKKGYLVSRHCAHPTA